ncbi:MAG: hypothetical protein WBW14_25115, partial [Candidatus Acidiferrum sp.]
FSPGRSDNWISEEETDWVARMGSRRFRFWGQAAETRGPRDRNNSGRPLTEISTASPQKWHFWLALARYGT